MSRRLNRRSLLRGAAGIGVALPLLDAMLPRHASAQAAAPPLRFGVFFSGNGVVEEFWVPKGGEKDFQITFTDCPQAPLEAIRNDINILYGLDSESSYMDLPKDSEGNQPTGNPHDLAMSTMLTGIRMKGNKYGRAGHVIDGTVGGPSVDQAIAKAIGGATKLRSLELGVQSTITDLEPLVTRMSYGGPNDPRTPLDDPKQVYTRLFADSATSQAELDAIRKRKKSVLDAVLGEFTSVNATLGYDDKQKLERHAENIRDIERQLDLTGMPLNANCKIPQKPTIDVDTFLPCTRDGRPNKCLPGFDQIGKIQMDLMIMALACDLTRVASLQWSTAESTIVHEQIGIADEHHLMSHDFLNKKMFMNQVNKWYAEQFAYMVTQLKSIPEGNGTLLDNVVLFYPNELSNPEKHDRRRLPYVLAGNAQGKIPTGRYLKYNGEPHNQLLAMFCNLFGMNVGGFGEADLPGVLSGITV
jgi:hypothetical protein